ncbi:MAG: ABC transporter ATP-binding protein [Clostridia bacterium]|nr:ABC transporter ATP-binding protein [Clostridia bacterium]
MTGKPIVQIKNIKKNIGKKAIIKDVTFDVFAGEVFGFLGPNGAGKTTTIRMMLGLMSITEGEIFINGYSIKKDFESAIACVGGIVENPEMYKYLSGYHNLLHYSRMYKGIKKERIEEVIKLVGLEKRIHDKVKTYSLGMRQRLGLAQALLHSPSLLVLDEPTNGLDPAGIRELRELLRKLAQEENIAVFVSSHLLSEMELMCDRIGIIQNGQLLNIQKVDEFLAEEKTTVSATFTVEPVSKAKACIGSIIKSKTSAVKNNQIEVEMEWEQIPEVVAKFIQEGIKVYGVQTATKTLEDKFLEATGGSEIA